MREWCGCGAAVHGRRRNVLTWRANHLHPATPPTPGGSHLEHAHQPIGFVPEEA